LIFVLIDVLVLDVLCFSFHRHGERHSVTTGCRPRHTQSAPRDMCQAINNSQSLHCIALHGHVFQITTSRQSHHRVVRRRACGRVPDSKGMQVEEMIADDHQVGIALVLTEKSIIF